MTKIKSKGRAIIGAIIAIAILLSVILVAKLLGTPISQAVDEAKITIEANLDKYINYNLSEQNRGTLVQYSIRTGMEYEKNQSYDPIKQSEVTMNLKQIDGKYPFEVKLVPVSTKATNGNAGFDKINYAYDSQTGAVRISTSNQNELGEAIYSEYIQKEKDQFIIIAYYDTYTETSLEREAGFDVVVKNSTFAQTNNEINKNGEFKVIVNENKGELTSIEYATDDVYNGYIKSNIINGTEYTTDYKETVQLTVSKKENQNRLQLTETNDNVIYKNTKVQKADIQKVLGESGTLQILDTEGNILTEINKDTQFEENGTYTFTYQTMPSSIVVKTSNVISEGILRLENTKEIKPEAQDLNETEIKGQTQLIGLNDIKTIENNEEKVKEQEAYKQSIENVVAIKDARTSVELNINSVQWTNERQNELTFEAKLNSNSSKYNMFKNPTIQINLPSEVEKVLLGDSSILYGNGLELNGSQVITNEDGSYSIIANISGEQTSYNENEMGLATTIKIPATVILKKNLQSGISNVNLAYTNEYNITGEVESGNVEKQVQIENYAEEDVPVLRAQGITSLFETATLDVQSTEDLQLEVKPVKGDTELSNGDTIYEGEFIKYNITVTNTSNQDIDNVNIIATIPEGMRYGELKANYYSYYPDSDSYYYEYSDENEISLSIGKVKANNNRTIYYEVKADDLQDDETEKQANSSVSLLVGNNEIQSYNINNVIKQAESQVYVETFLDNGKNLWDYRVTVTGNSEVTWNMHMPKGYQLTTENAVGAFGSTGWDRSMYEISDDNVLTATVTPGTYIIYGIIDGVEIEQNSENSESILAAYATVSTENNTYTSNEARIIFKYESASIEISSETEGEEVKFEDEINYKIVVTNTGGTNNPDVYYSSTSVDITDFLPDNVEPVSITYDTWEEEQQHDGDTIIQTGIFNKSSKTEEIYKDVTDGNNNKLANINLKLNIPYGESVTIDVTTTAGLVDEKTEIENSATVSGDSIISKTSNSITHYILPYNYIDPDNPDNPYDPDNPDTPDEPDIPDNPDTPDSPDNPTDPNAKYSVSGIAWLDKNEDGQRQTDEKLLNGITVMLVDMNNTSAIKAKAETNSNGEYSFSEIEAGNYVIVFRYDTNKYSLTEYKKSGVITTLNSDATEDTITLNGQQESVGITDTISLSENMLNIDIGLIENKTNSNIKVDKYINKVQVTTNKRTKDKTYNNAKLAKTEIRAKEIEGAQVKVEYKIVITNKGESSAKAGQVIDYIPDGFEFSKNNNPSWENKAKGQIVNTSIENSNIGAGESVELTLVLTKTMTENSTGTFTNKVQIGENTSSADVIISVSTGHVIIYVSIAIGLLLAVGACIYFIRKYGFKKINKATLSILMLIGIISAGTTISTAYPNPAYFEYGGWGPWPYYGNQYGGTYFYGSSGQGDGLCIQAGRPAYDGDYWYYDYEWTGGGSYVVQDPDVSITLSKGNENIEMKSSGTDYIYGPFKINCNYNGGYSFDIRDNNGSAITSYTLCNSSGSRITVKGTMTFYIKISKSKCANGVGYVKVSATRSGTKITESYTDGRLKYTPGYSQDVRTFNSMRVRTDRSYSQVSNTKSVTWTDINGGLDIVKQDKDNSNAKLKDVKFNVKCSKVGYDKDFTTNANGEIHIENLRRGTYTITEKSNSNYGYVVSVKDTVNIINGKQVNKIEKNEKQTGNIVIYKKDYDTSINLQGMEFKLKNSKGYIIAKTGNNKQTLLTANNGNPIYLTDIAYTSNAASATTFTTNSNGQIKIVNIPIGSYTVEETSVGTKYYGYAKSTDASHKADFEYVYSNTSDKVSAAKKSTKDTSTGNPTMAVTVTRQSSTSTSSASSATSYNSLYVYNQKKYTKLSGYVWEDAKIQSGKDLINNYLRGDSEDVKVDGIKVTLKSISGNGSLVTYSDNTAFKNTKVTASGGNYVFDDVLIGGKLGSGTTVKGIEDYYIEFEYDGEIYTTAKSFDELGYQKALERTGNNTQKSQIAKTSKVQEVLADRNRVDRNYSEISTTSAMNGTSSTSRASGNFNINYTENMTGTESGNPEAISKNMNWFNSRLSSDKKTRAVNEFNGNGYENFSYNKATANTKETGYNVLGGTTIADLRAQTNPSLENRNCGLIVRDQIDLSITQDVYNVKVEAGEYANTYNYNIIDNYTEKEFKNSKSDTGVNNSYDRQLYESDILAKDKKDGFGYKVNVTYKIEIHNHSNVLDAQATEFVNYFSTKYSSEKANIKVYDGNVNGPTTERAQNTYQIASNYNAQYHKNTIILNDNTKIPAEGTRYVYITYQVTDTELANILKAGRSGVKAGSIAEITKYKTYYNDKTYYHNKSKISSGSSYASIDKNSAPGNLVNDVDKINPYEDDTDKAPYIRFYIEEERTITGTVFEDTQTKASKNNNQRLGDGKYGKDEINGGNERTIGEVKVDLLVYEENKNASDLKVANLYGNNYENGVKVATTMTDKNGAYTFDGIIPGKYMFRFTYSDGSVLYKNSSDTGTPLIDVDKYKSTIITSDVIGKAINNNNIVGDNSTAKGVINYNGVNYDANKWEVINEGTRYSDAVDNKDIVAQSFEYQTITNENYIDNFYNTGITQKDAYTGEMNIQIEFDVNELSGGAIATTVDSITAKNKNKVVTQVRHTISNVDFGIIERAKQSVDVKKEIANVKITLANGQVIVNGDPSKPMSYVRYFNDESSGFRRARVSVELDNELIHGATLELTYVVTAENKSENNWLSRDYYINGIANGEKEKIKITQLLDYLDKDLVYNAQLENIDKVEVLENIDAIAKKIKNIEILKNKYNFLSLSGNNELAPGETETWTYGASKLLTVGQEDDLQYDNNVESVEYKTTNSISTMESIVGNSLFTEEKDVINNELDSYRGLITITSATGENRSYTIYIVAGTALIALAGGVLIIKRKIL